MERWWRAYAVLGVITVVLLLLSPAKSHFREWRFYQERYNLLLKNLPTGSTATNTGLQQVWVETADRIDRCISCHVGFDNPSAGNLEQPFNSHPKIPHDPREFGCTVCHQGQGLATDYISSIGLVEHWDRPIFPQKYTEAGCGRCHKETQVPDSPILNAGRRMMEKYSCAACHDLPGIAKNYIVPLDGVGVRIERIQLYRWLSSPRRVKPTTRMPEFLFSKEQSADLTDYLLSFTTLADGSTLPIPTSEFEAALASDIRIEKGGVLFREARCISCHLVEGKGGTIAEELGTAGTFYSATWISQYISSPKRLLTGVPMPRYGFSDDQLLDLTAYISGELRDWEFDPGEIELPDPQPGFMERGKALWTINNCVGCHSLTGAPIEGERGPSLAEIGVKPTYNLDLAWRKDVPPDMPFYLKAKLTASRAFGPGLRMPQFGFKAEEIDSLVTALLANGGGEELRSEMPAPPIAPHQPNLNGPIGRLFDRYSCLTCHSLQGYGGTIAPDLTAIGSQLSSEWIRGYMQVPFSRRPILTERMPNFFISNAEIDTLLDFIRLNLVDDEIDKQTVPTGTSHQIELGKSLFYEKFSCQACHQIKGKGGYVGPPLDGAAKRLKPGWVKVWLDNPELWRPSTVEPHLPMNTQEGEALVSYMMSL